MFHDCLLYPVYYRIFNLNWGYKIYYYITNDNINILIQSHKKWWNSKCAKQLFCINVWASFISHLQFVSTEWNKYLLFWSLAISSTYQKAIFFPRSKEISIETDGWHADMFYVDIFKGFFIFNKLIFKQVFLLQNVIQIWPTKWKIWFVWVPWVRWMK